MVKIHNKPRSCEEGGEKELFVVRTIAKGETGLERFSSDLAWNLGPNASIKTVGSMYLQLLGNMRPTLLAHHVTAKDLRGLKLGLECRFIAELSSSHASNVGVDEKNPLILLGAARNRLALNITPTEDLMAQRRIGAEFIRERFGSVPMQEDTGFSIVLGKLDGDVVHRARNDIMCLLEQEGQALVPPKEISVNGLEVMLGRVHARETHIRFVK